MSDVPSVSAWAVALAAIVAFAWGGIYFAAIAPRVERQIGIEAGPAVTAPAALIAALITRGVLAYGLAVILAYADVGHPVAGALGGLAVFATILLPVQVGQAAFNNATSSWRRLAVSVPELAIGMAIMGAIGVFWR